MVKKASIFAIIEGLSWSTVTVLLLIITLPSDVLTRNPHPEFARRFDGECTGWTVSLSMWDVGQNIGLWYVYCTMAVVLRRLHPIPIARFSLTHVMMQLFIAGCGFKHLLDAYTVFSPVYVCSVSIGWMLVMVSLSALWYIATSLEAAKHQSNIDRHALKSFADGNIPRGIQ